jgi:hypothetical protein
MTNTKFSSRALLEASHNRPSMTALHKLSVELHMDPVFRGGDPSVRGSFDPVAYRAVLRKHQEAHPVDPVPAHGRGPAPVISNTQQRTRLARDAAVRPSEDVSCLAGLLNDDNRKR